MPSWPAMSVASVDAYDTLSVADAPKSWPVILSVPALLDAVARTPWARKLALSFAATRSGVSPLVNVMLAEWPVNASPTVIVFVPAPAAAKEKLFAVLDTEALVAARVIWM